MYLPPHFTQSDPQEIESFVKAHPFATVVTMVDGQMWPTQIPLFMSHGDTVIGHVARNNQMWRHDTAHDVLVVFSGTDAYITPNWYKTKQLTHEVVPTWNYTSVCFWGTLKLHDDAQWKRMAVGKLTQIHERMNETPWKMGDAPQDFLESQLENIIGIEISVTRTEAKWKLNQNRTDADRRGVIAGLHDRSTGHDSAISYVMQSMLADE